jgi:hypothetical protein
MRHYRFTFLQQNLASHLGRSGKKQMFRTTDKIYALSFIKHIAVRTGNLMKNLKIAEKKDEKQNLGRTLKNFRFDLDFYQKKKTIPFVLNQNQEQKRIVFGQ